MFQFEVSDLENNLNLNSIIFKKIDLNENISCFILIDSGNKKNINLILNKIIDLLIDNITSKDIYNKFSISLENINFFIKTLKTKEHIQEELNIFIGILDKNNFYFSKIGTVSCNLINSKKEFLEVSDKNDKLTTFDFISSGKLNHNEKIIISNINIIDNLNSSDINEISNLDDVKNITDNIIKILKDENLEKNIKVLTINYENSILEEKNNNVLINNIGNLFYKFFDNNFSKKVIALFLILKDKLNNSGKIIKNIVFLTGIGISTFLLYLIISGVIGTTVNNSKIVNFKENLIKAREYIRIANENIANPEVFDLNIKKAEELISQVKENNLFLNDINSINDDISIIKKQFNGIEVFDNNSSNIIFSGNFSDAIKLLELNKKFYILTTNSIYGPIISGQEIKNNIFSQLDIDDEFLDATVNGENIVIVTKKNRVINFSKEGQFRYINVIGQTTWQGSSFIESYNNNIYLTNTLKNQIYRHSPSSGNYTSGVPYLNDFDSNNIGKILAIGIDGGIYILKNDLTLVKFFSAPKYRFEKIVLNKLPKNYFLENEKVSFFIRNNLNYIYLLLNNKIWIFKPNTKIFTDTKSLTYIGQIETKNDTIKGFFVPRDNEINILTSKGIYKLNFDVKDDKLILR